MPGMSNVGRRIGTPTEYREAIIERTRKAREKLGLNQQEMAEKLSAECQRPISADTYRQWEKETTLPLDVIMPLCNMAHIHPWEFLAPVPFSKASSAPVRSRKSAA
jgi:transcriptional regulator with XRE-family HTH domain